MGILEMMLVMKLCLLLSLVMLGQSKPGPKPKPEPKPKPGPFNSILDQFFRPSPQRPSPCHQWPLPCQPQPPPCQPWSRPCQQPRPPQPYFDYNGQEVMCRCRSVVNSCRTTGSCVVDCNAMCRDLKWGKVAGVCTSRTPCMPSSVIPLSGGR